MCAAWTSSLRGAWRAPRATLAACLLCFGRTSWRGKEGGRARCCGEERRWEEGEWTDMYRETILAAGLLLCWCSSSSVSALDSRSTRFSCAALRSAYDSARASSSSLCSLLISSLSASLLPSNSPASLRSTACCSCRDAARVQGTIYPGRSPALACYGPSVRVPT